MTLSGQALMIDIPSDPTFKERFWYWQGASGKRYIHSVYRLEDCPPLPGAVYVAVRRQGDVRAVVAVGRFTPFWEAGLSAAVTAQLREAGVNELHVHLMAKSPVQREAIVDDLDAGHLTAHGASEAVARKLLQGALVAA